LACASISGMTIRHAASTSASGFASCRGPAFRTGSRHVIRHAMGHASITVDARSASG
jgi:hypothetical protein